MSTLCRDCGVALAVALRPFTEVFCPFFVGDGVGGGFAPAFCVGVGDVSRSCRRCLVTVTLDGHYRWWSHPNGFGVAASFASLSLDAGEKSVMTADKLEAATIV